MVNPVAVAVTIAALVAVLVALLLAWRRRLRAQQHLRLPSVPADTGAPLAVFDGLHVATTFASRPLERVVAGGLGFRARTALTVTDAGLLVERVGSPAVFLPTADLSAGTATWALDRGVERDGLAVVGWSLADAEGTPVAVESAFRLPPEAQARFLAHLHDLVGARVDPLPGGAA